MAKKKQPTIAINTLSEEEARTRITEFAETLVQSDFSAGRAAEKMGLTRNQGYDLVKRDDVMLAIARALVDHLSPAEKVKQRYMDLALNGDLADFEKVRNGSMTLDEARASGLPTWMIRECRDIRDKNGDVIGADVKLYSLEVAMKALAEVRDLKGDITINIGEIQQNVTPGLSAYEALTERLQLEAFPEGGTEEEAIDVEYKECG